MCDTTDFSVEPKVDEKMKKELHSDLRAERRKKQAEGEDKGKVATWEKTQKAKNEVEVAKTKSRPKRYHAFMLVEPFLPDIACAGGPTINWTARAEPNKIDPKTGKPEKTDDQKRDDDRDVEIFKLEKERESRAKGEGLGNWLQPVMEKDGEVVDHNPLTDSYGKILDTHKHGKAGSTKYGTPWDSDQQALSSSGMSFADAPRGKGYERDKDGKRIHILPDVTWREFATDPRESQTIGEQDPWLNIRRDLGMGFEGYKGHATTEVADLDHLKMPLHPSVNNVMRGRTGGQYS